MHALEGVALSTLMRRRGLGHMDTKASIGACTMAGCILHMAGGGSVTQTFRRRCKAGVEVCARLYPGRRARAPAACGKQVRESVAPPLGRVHERASGDAGG
eukprot:6210841-Pleurochrysis_carterae.AAC.2